MQGWAGNKVVALGRSEDRQRLFNELWTEFENSETIRENGFFDNRSGICDGTTATLFGGEIVLITVQIERAPRSARFRFICNAQFRR